MKISNDKSLHLQNKLAYIKNKLYTIKNIHLQYTIFFIKIKILLVEAHANLIVGL